jgi:hypothetical protein
MLERQVQRVRSKSGTGVHTKRLLFQRQKDCVEKLDIFEVVINHVVKFESLRRMRITGEDQYTDWERLTGVHDVSLQMVSNVVFTAHIDATSSAIRASRIALPRDKKTLWMQKRVLSLSGERFLITS